MVARIRKVERVKSGSADRFAVAVQRPQHLPAPAQRGRCGCITVRGAAGALPYGARLAPRAGQPTPFASRPRLPTPRSEGAAGTVPYGARLAPRAGQPTPFASRPRFPTPRSEGAAGTVPYGGAAGTIPYGARLAPRAGQHGAFDRKVECVKSGSADRFAVTVQPPATLASARAARALRVRYRTGALRVRCCAEVAGQSEGD